MRWFTVTLPCVRIACYVVTNHTKPLTATVLTTKDGVVTAGSLQAEFTVWPNSVFWTITGPSDLITENTTASLNFKRKQILIR